MAGTWQHRFLFIKPRSFETPHLKADAILTDNPELTLLMLFADCVPILLYDTEKSISGIAHAGWQGTINKVVKIMVEKMIKDHECKRDKIIACIGPSICVHDYQVGENVLEAVAANFPVTDEIIFKKAGGYYLNLQAANQLTLKEAGIKNIHDAGICTAENTGDWFSHRAENGETGRFAAVMTCDRYAC